MILQRHLLCLLTLLTGTAFSSPAKPNIVFILADDLGWADTTLYGHTKFYRTPNLERLAKSGMTFTRAYSASPLCSPTRASILTGQHPARLGLTSPTCHLPAEQLVARRGTKAPPGLKAIQPQSATRLRTDLPTLSKDLKEAGYRTGHFGKWHLGPAPYSPLQQGFEIDLPHWPGPGPKGSYVAPWRYPDFDPAHPKEHIEDRMAKEAAAFIEQNKDRPFFLNYWQFSVHAPFDAKKELIAKYRKLVDSTSPQRCPTYAAMIESMDDAVGTLLDTLEKFNLTGNTLIIFFSDNGGNMYNLVEGVPPTSNHPLRGGKATQFEGGIRVPCIVSWPGQVAKGTRSKALVQSTDFYPTIINLLGLEKEPNQVFDGMSIAPALKGKALKKRPIFTYFPHNPPVPDWIPPSISVHYEEWKLIREFHQGENGAHRYRLFNLEKDQGESENLAAKDPERVRDLDQLITDFLKETKAVVPVPNPDFDPAKYRPDLEGKNQVGRRSKKPGKKTKADPFDPKLKGWKARQTDYSLKNGVIQLKPTGRTSFLGVGAAGFAGEATLSFRIKGGGNTRGKVTWSNQSPDPGSKPYQLTSDEWETKAITFTPEKNAGILRLHLPEGDESVEIDWIELKSKTKQTRWDF
ncbi:MAG: sulfatase [Akkermansiaceae bacterium]|jgi:arylsulfatase A-like enzyme